MIKAQSLVKCFGPKLAVDNVSFEVKRGDVLGFLGPNGAGKSTTMRMITGFLPPTSGTVNIGESDVRTDPIAAKQQIGYLPENAPAYPEMTVTGFLKFVAEIKGLRGKERSEAVDKAIDTCFLESVRHQTIDTLSKGYRQRTCFAQAIIADPPVLVLDEPTDGLDPNQKTEVRNLIKRMGKEKAIILSTHILEEVEAVCSRVIIIDRGKLVADDTPSGLLKKSPSAGQITVSIMASAASAKEQLKAIPEVNDVFVLSEKGDKTSLRVTPEENAKEGLAGKVAEALVKSGTAFSEMHTEPGRLEEVFKMMTVSEITGEHLS